MSEESDNILLGKVLDSIISNDEFGKAIDFLSENPNSINWSFYIDRLMNPIHLVSNKISNRGKQKLLDMFPDYLDNISKNQVIDLTLVASFIRAKLFYIMKVSIDFSFISKFEIMCSEKIKTSRIIHPHSFLNNSGDISRYDSDFIYEYVVCGKSLSEIVSSFFKKVNLNKLTDNRHYELIPLMFGYSLFSNFLFNRCDLHNLYVSSPADIYLIFKMIDDFLKESDEITIKGTSKRYKKYINLIRALYANNRYMLLTKCYIQCLFGESMDMMDEKFSQIFHSLIKKIIETVRIDNKSKEKEFQVFDEVILENAILGKGVFLNDLYNSVGMIYEKDALEYFRNMGINCIS